ncbi:CinA family nicotinamide mononucleotide deamidase-related protein [Thalassotalea sp. G2M2-11]|uniref:CinA family nicotinamide mononucleotide deamidase-related protein n=1 Tax=Thalassotalea sp. G2M2-11 TaxID=2787627 RepID=UPI0019CFCF39
MAQLNIQLLLTGNELMTGDIVDTNSVMIAQQLIAIGASIERKITVADDIDILVSEIQQMSQSADILIINGGLGPTTDDLTALALAKASKRQLAQHPQALAHLQAWCDKKATQLDEANLTQAMLPDAAKIIPNDIGSAVGFIVNYQGCDIYCTPGVPKELEHMMEQYILPEIKHQLPNTEHYIVKRYQVFGIGESKLQQLITEHLPDWPSDVLLGFRAASPMLEVKLTVKHKHQLTQLELWQKKLLQLLGDHVLRRIDDNKMHTMAELVLAELVKQKQSITTVESCTGGLIASLLTNIAGASQAFEAGFVTYSNQMKSQMVGVCEQTLNTHGAVSEQVVIEMAKGALERTHADYAIAVSGIAGPEGGSPDKPVGSVWLTIATKQQATSYYFCIKGDRQYFQLMVAQRALDLVRRLLINSEQLPFYC